MPVVTKRLQELQTELAKGQRHLDALEHERQELRDTLLRISGAIQVLEELLKQDSSGSTGSEA